MLLNKVTGSSPPKGTPTSLFNRRETADGQRVPFPGRKDLVVFGPAVEREREREREREERENGLREGVGAGDSTDKNSYINQLRKARQKIAFYSKR